MVERARLEMQTDDLLISVEFISVEGESKDFWHEDLHTRAVTELIDEADLHG